MPEEIIRLLRCLEGIAEAELLCSKDRRKILEIEDAYEESAFLPLKNLGMEITARRDRVIVLLKDPKFRKPPAATVYLVEEEEKSVDGRVLHVENKSYRVIGEEILDSNRKYAEKTMFLGDSFVLYPDRRGSKSKLAFFLVPPLPFPELEERRDYFKIRDIVSVSPSSSVDQYLRESFGFSKETIYATLLIGFNLQGGVQEDRRSGSLYR